MSSAVSASIDANVPDPAARRALRVAVCGEVCSGKSALVNGLLRNAVLPDFFGEASRPEVRIETGGTPSWTGVYADGKTVELDPGKPVPLEDGIVQLVIRTGDQAPHLQGIELVELPPLYDEHITEEQIARVGQFDVLVWATIGSQAWRLSEKTILDLLGAARPERSILAITRADKFRKAADRRKVFERVEKNAEPYFDKVLLTSASASKVKASKMSEKAWEETGLAEIHRWILSQMDAADAPPRGDGEVVALADYRESEADADPVVEADADPVVEADADPVVEADAEPVAEAVEAVHVDEPAPELDAPEAAPQAEAAPPQEDAPEKAEVEVVFKAAERPKLEPEPRDVSLDADPRIHVLATVKLGADQTSEIKVGDQETAEKFVELAREISAKAVSSSAYEGLDIYDMGMRSSHILFGPTGNDQELLVLVSKADIATRGAARALFLRERDALA